MNKLMQKLPEQIVRCRMWTNYGEQERALKIKHNLIKSKQVLSRLSKITFKFNKTTSIIK